MVATFLCKIAHFSKYFHASVTRDSCPNAPSTGEILVETGSRRDFLCNLPLLCGCFVCYPWARSQIFSTEDTVHAGLAVPVTDHAKPRFAVDGSATIATNNFHFLPKEISTNSGSFYTNLVADINGDGNPDVVAVAATKLVWFENPGWNPHIILTNSAINDSISFSDIDFKGEVDLVLGVDLEPGVHAHKCTLEWVHRAPEKPNGEWTIHPIASAYGPLQMRWGNIDGGSTPHLAVLSREDQLLGMQQSNPTRSQILVFHVPTDPGCDQWQMEIAADRLADAGDFQITDGEICVGTGEGTYLLRRQPDGRWSRRKIGESASIEAKIGRVNRVRTLATVEFQAGASIVVCQEPTHPLNPQRETLPRPVPISKGIWGGKVIETGLTGAPLLAWADFDADGSDELLAAWGHKASSDLAIYKRNPSGDWEKTALDSPSEPTKSISVADLNNDSRPEIITIGKPSGKLKVFWNESRQNWARHVITHGFRAQSAVAADFTGRGRIDVISGDIEHDHKIMLYCAPDWQPVLLQTGIRLIQSAAIDLDGDGRSDFLGTQYHPGLIFWLERPKDPIHDPWRYHVIDSAAQAGVDGVHGLAIADVDGDGRPELIASSDWPEGPVSNSIVWFKIPSDPSSDPHWERYTLAYHDAPGFIHYIGTGDVNGDGHLDVATGAKVGPAGNYFAWWQQREDPRQPWLKSVIAKNQEGATNILMADVNGDGMTDFVASRGHGKGVLWFEAPHWEPHDIDPNLVGPHALAVGDIDGDGDPDVVCCAKDSGILAWYENDGRGHFTPHYIYENQSAYDVKLVDMNGDGDLDIVVAGQESQNVVWYENRLR